MHFSQKHRVEQASKKSETLWEAKWLASLDASRRRMLPTAIGRMGVRPSTPPPLLPENERIASRIS